MLVTRYFFSQFWSEFTKRILTEFLTEDLNFKQKNILKSTRKQGSHRSISKPDSKK